MSCGYLLRPTYCPRTVRDAVENGLEGCQVNVTMVVARGYVYAFHRHDVWVNPWSSATRQYAAVTTDLHFERLPEDYTDAS